MWLIQYGHRQSFCGVYVIERFASNHPPRKLDPFLNLVMAMPSLAPNHDSAESQTHKRGWCGSIRVISFVTLTSAQTTTHKLTLSKKTAKWNPNGTQIKIPLPILSTPTVRITSPMLRSGRFISWRQKQKTKSLQTFGKSDLISSSHLYVGFCSQPYILCWIIIGQFVRRNPYYFPHSK